MANRSPLIDVAAVFCLGGAAVSVVAVVWLGADATSSIRRGDETGLHEQLQAKDRQIADLEARLDATRHPAVATAIEHFSKDGVHYIVAEDLAAAWANPSMPRGRLLPHRDAYGLIDGLKLYAEPPSLPRQIGFRKLDIIQTINGHHMLSEQALADVWRVFDGTPGIVEVELRRRGRRRNSRRRSLKRTFHILPRARFEAVRATLDLTPKPPPAKDLRQWLSIKRTGPYGYDLRANAGYGATFREALGLVTWEAGSSGVHLSKVRRESVPYQVGLRSDDIVFAVDELPVRDRGDLQLAWDRVHRRDEVRIDLWRDGEAMALYWTLHHP